VIQPQLREIQIRLRRTNAGGEENENESPKNVFDPDVFRHFFSSYCYKRDPKEKSRMP